MPASVPFSAGVATGLRAASQVVGGATQASAVTSRLRSDHDSEAGDRRGHGSLRSRLLRWRGADDGHVETAFRSLVSSATAFSDVPARRSASGSGWSVPVCVTLSFLRLDPSR